MQSEGLGSRGFVIPVLRSIAYKARIKSRDKHKDYWIQLAMDILHGTTYLEIGVRKGACFRRIKCSRRIAVDPVRFPEFDRLHCNELFYEKESDQFFAEDARDLFRDGKIDVALVDGLHEFRQALRDVLNIERHIQPNGVVFIHDCSPPTRKQAEVRDGGTWTGDVWKVAYYLVKYRSDLHFLTISCDQGVGVLTGFRRDIGIDCIDYFRVHEHEIAACKELDYKVLEQDRENVLNLRSIKHAKEYFKNMEFQLRDGSELRRGSDQK